MPATPRGFAWWDTHDRSWRRARVCFVAAVLTLAVLALGIVLVIAAPVWAAAAGEWHDPSWWGDHLFSWWALVGVATALVSCIAAVAFVGWQGLPRLTARLLPSRPPDEVELQPARQVLDTVAVAYGMTPPVLRVVDDLAPNGLAYGRPGRSVVCLTTGALRLPRPQLEAMCMFHTTALASRAFAYSTAAADLLLLAEWLTRVAWWCGAAALLLAVFGLPIEVLGAFVLGVLVLIVATRPILYLTDRLLVELLDDAAALTDLEAVQHTAQPGSLAQLLLTLLEDGQRVESHWEVAHLWFERDTVEARRSSSRAAMVLSPMSPTSDVPTFIERCTQLARPGLVRRARIAVDLASGDARLRKRLARVERG